MTLPEPEVPRQPEDFLDRGRDPDLFAHIEGLIGEEDALLEIPAEEREQQHHHRLREIGHELDRIFERLHERARRLGHHGSTEGGGP